MNNGKIFVAKATGKAYYGRKNGIDLNTTVPNFDKKDYQKIGDNQLFEIYKLKQ